MIVTSVILAINGKEICIEVKDAEKLYNDLDKIFGKKEYIYPQATDKYNPPYVWYTTGRAIE